MIRILSAARTVVVFGVILQVAGFVKLLVIADYFGAGPLLDAYYLGLVIPTFLAGVSAGILQTGFVPAYVGARARGTDATARTLGNATLTWTTLALGGVDLHPLVAPGLNHNNLTKEPHIDLLAAELVRVVRAVTDARGGRQPASVLSTN